MRILYIEDDPTNVRLVQKMLNFLATKSALQRVRKPG